ncbi:MAG TPA: APC family permease [Candidatus Bathyarchaeia archaeon]|nr:APC family permease [Candidatus Bathyarchaeia archaeon]
MAEEKLFVRKATGLVREIGAVTAVIIVLANTIGLGWQKRVFQYTGKAPLPENMYFAGIPPMAMAFIIGGIAILLSVLAVSVLSAAMPRSGGGYVVISRVLGPVWGFLGAWLEFLSIAWSFGIIAVAVFEGLYFIMGPIAFGLNFTTPGGIPQDVFLFLVGIVLVVVFTVIGVFGIKLTGLLLQGMFWIPAVLTFYVFGLLSQATTANVQLGMTNVLGHAPSEYVTAALNQGLDAKGMSAGGYVGAVQTALIGAYFAYIGYAASTFVAGEIKEANKSLPRTLILASLLIIALYVSISLVAANAIKGIAPQTVNGNTYSLLSAWSYLSYGGGDFAKAVPILPNVSLWTTTLAGLTGNAIGLGGANFLLVVFGILWIANDIPPFILTGSRILFAMSFDRVLPTRLSNINDRFHSPINAVIITGIIAILGCFSESQILDVGHTLNQGGNTLISNVLGSGGGVQITDFYDSFFFTLFTLSLVILPLRASRRQIFETAPYKPGGKWGMVLIGIGGFAANLVVDYFFAVAPGGDFGLGSINWSSPTLFNDLFAVIFTIIVAILGIVVFFVHRNRRGINYSTIFAQIPPE